ncbi:MAG: hypothetical protein ACE5G0_15590 [Rhodothermales bacterium]
MRPPTDMRLRYEWHEGTVPPPHYYDYIIEFGPDPQGTIRYCPGYDFQDPPVWIERFDVEADAWQRLCALVDASGILEREPPPDPDPEPVGGSLCWLEIVAPEARMKQCSYGSPSGAMREVVNAMKALVPDAVWSGLRTRHEHFVESQEGA